MTEIVDIHTHVIATDTVKYPRAPLGGTQSDWSRERPTSPEQMLAAMDAAGVAKSAVVQASTCYGYDNSYLAEAIALYPKRFTGVFCMDMFALDAAATFAHWTSRGMTGMRLFTTGSTQPGQAGWLADPATFPVWELAEAANLPVCLQMRPEGVPQLLVLLERFKRVPIVLDHLARVSLSDGAPYAKADWLWDLAQYPNIFLKLTSRTAEESQKGLATPKSFFPRLVEAFGADRIAFGSNFPAHEGPLSHLVEEVEHVLVDLTKVQRDWIMGGTALRLYPSLVG